MSFFGDMFNTLFGNGSSGGSGGASAQAGLQVGKDASNLSDPFQQFRNQFATMLAGMFGGGNNPFNPGGGMADKSLLNPDSIKPNTSLLTVDPQKIMNDPSYQFEKGATNNAVLASQNATGALNSGSTLLELQKQGGALDEQFVQNQSQRNLAAYNADLQGQEAKFGAGLSTFGAENAAQNQGFNQQNTFMNYLMQLSGATPNNAMAAGSNLIGGFQAGTQAQDVQNKQNNSDSGGFGNFFGNFFSSFFG